MNIDKQVQLINLELKKDKNISANKIIDKLGLKKSQLRKAKYSYNADLRQYVKDVGQQGRQDVGQATKLIIEPKKDNIVPGTTNDLMIQNNYLKDNMSVLIEMIEQYKKHNYVVQGKDIVVQLPQEDNGKYKISLRVNQKVMEQFKEFCNKHKQFTQKELISQALLEFMEKYK